MRTTRIIRILDRDQVITGLAGVRKEWEQAAQDDNLVDTMGSIGLMLVDIADAIELTPAEKTRALGSKLVKQAHKA